MKEIVLYVKLAWLIVFNRDVVLAAFGAIVVYLYYEADIAVWMTIPVGFVLATFVNVVSEYIRMSLKTHLDD